MMLLYLRAKVADNNAATVGDSRFVFNNGICSDVNLLVVALLFYTEARINVVRVHYVFPPSILDKLYSVRVKNSANEESKSARYGSEHPESLLRQHSQHVQWTLD